LLIFTAVSSRVREAVGDRAEARACCSCDLGDLVALRSAQTGRRGVLEEVAGGVSAAGSGRDRRLDGLCRSYRYLPGAGRVATCSEPGLAAMKGDCPSTPRTRPRPLVRAVGVHAA
jgi:hypothetical protein